MGHIINHYFAQDEIPIRNQIARKFKIESVTGRCFKIVDGLKSHRSFKGYLLTYSRSGTKFRQKKFNSEGKMVYDWKYNAKGDPLQEIAYEASGKINYRFEFIYNNDGYWEEKRMYVNSNHLQYYVIPIRDKSGRIISENYYDPSGQKFGTESHIYDDLGRLIRIDMGHKGEWLYEYDESGNLKRKLGNLSSADIFGENFEYAYDDSELLLKMTHLHHSITFFKYTFFP